MLDLATDFRRLADGPSDERTRALERIIPPLCAQRALQQTGHARRRCPLLPRWLVVWLVIGLGLFAPDCYALIYKRLRRLKRGATPSRAATAAARKGLGTAALRLLAAKVVRLLGQERAPGCFYKGQRLMALGGCKLDLPDSEANARAFGRPKGKKGQGAFPQARVLALCEAGTLAIWRHQVKPGHRGEIGMAPVLLRHAEAGMLVPWGRNFFSREALEALRGRGAHLLRRLKRPVLTEALEALPDGSYLAKAYAAPKHRRHDEGGIVARAIEYTLEDPGRPVKATERVHRLMTALLGPKAHPAEELAVLYHERWEEELTIDEVKAHRRGRPVLRSGAPAGVVQEIDGLLLAHYAVRALVAEAAAEAGAGPRQLSFVGALKVLRCRLPEAPKDPHDAAGRRSWWRDLVAGVGELALPPRRDRVNPRAIRRQQSKWPRKRPRHRRPRSPCPSANASAYADIWLLTVLR
jgi:hypothetical protein